MENTTTSWPQLTELLTKGTRKQAQILIKATIQRYPSSNIGPESVAAFTNDWAGMIREVGIRRFWTGLHRAIQATSFFPVLSDIRRHMPDPEMLGAYSGPSAQDLSRKASGERSYGLADIKELWKMFKGRWTSGKPVTKEEVEQLLSELDRRIDNLQTAERKV